MSNKPHACSPSHTEPARTVGGCQVTHAGADPQPPSAPPALPGVRHKLLVMSGKGGVGKSTVAVNLAATLAHLGYRVGLMDVDIHGPSIPTLLKLEGWHPVVGDEGRIQPVEFGSLKVMSIGLLLKDRLAPVIWRGPMKMTAIKQFIEEVAWGELDYLIVDAPPGTGDEPLSVAQLLQPLDGAVIVTTPQEVALADVRRSIGFCREVGLTVLGVIENMSGFVCPHCGQVSDPFSRGGGETMAGELDVPFLGRIPLDGLIVQTCDDGQPFVQRHPEAPAAKALAAIIEALIVRTGGAAPAATPAPAVAIDPVARRFGRMNAPDAAASVTGPCGDTMEFHLVIADGRIVDAMYWTEGCEETRRCGAAVADWVCGRPLLAALNLSAGMVTARLPALSAAHRHCPILAVSAFYRAAAEYLLLP